MKAKEVLKKLRITRPTLSKYVKEGMIKVNKKPNNRYEYDDESVYKFLNNGEERKTILYIRGVNQKAIDFQKELLERYTFSKGYTIDKVIVIENVSGDKNNIKPLIEEISNGTVQRVITFSLDRLTRKSIVVDLLEEIFLKNNCQLITLKDENENVFAENIDNENIAFAKNCNVNEIDEIFKTSLNSFINNWKMLQDDEKFKYAIMKDQMYTSNKMARDEFLNQIFIEKLIEKDIITKESYDQYKKFFGNN